MGELGDLLELVLDKRERFDTVQATIRHWRDRDRATTSEPPLVSGRRREKQPRPPQESFIKLWLVPYDEPRSKHWRPAPARARIETSYDVNGVPETSVTVIDRDQWWSYSPSDGAFHNPGERTPAPERWQVDRLFDPASFKRFFTDLDLQPVGRGNVAGRGCVHVRGVRADTTRIWSHELPHEATAYDFLVDRDRGVVLSFSALVGEEAFEISEVTEISFDEPVAHDLFVFAPPSGVEVRPAPRIAEQLSLDEAARRAPFKVLVPADLVETPPGDLRIMFHPERMQRGHRVPPSVFVSYGSSSGFLSEHADGDASDEYEWHEIDHGGTRLLVSDVDAQPPIKRVVRVTKAGTTADLVSDLPFDRATELVATLIPVA